jgi:transcriptional regulator with XRE-family HTH domain
MTTDKKFQYKFCSNLLIAIDKSELKQQEFAKKIGCSKNTLSHWINGYCTPNIYAVAKMAEVLGVSIDELVKGGEGG